MKGNFTMNNKAPNKHSDARSFEMRRLIFLGAAGVLILVVVILSLLSAFGGKSDGQSTGNGTSSAVTEDGKLVIQDLYEGEITIPKFNVPLNTYDQSKFKNDNGLVTYDDANASLGIDVSDYQGDIDWAAVKASGIDFAMIRAGYRGATRGKLNEDSKFADNYTGAKDAGVKVGIYFFSQATSVTEAEEEAVRQMGDPEVAGRDMGRLYSKVLDYKMLFFFWGMGIFGCLAFWASSDSWDTEPISLGLFDGMPETIFHIFGLTLLMFGLFWSGVEKWVNVGTFYAWAKNWHGGGIVNSAVMLILGIMFLSQGQKVSFMVFLVVAVSLFQLLERALIELYRQKKERELLWKIGYAKTSIFPYKGEGEFGGRKRKVIAEDGMEIPQGAPIMVIGLEGMKPIVARI